MSSFDRYVMLKRNCRATVRAYQSHHLPYSLMPLLKGGLHCFLEATATQFIFILRKAMKALNHISKYTVGNRLSFILTFFSTPIFQSIIFLRVQIFSHET